MTSSAIVRRHPAPIAAVALAFTAAYTLAIGSAGGDRPPTRERANAVLARPATVTALRDVARLPALRRVKPPAPKPRAPVATRAAALPPSPVPVATATPPPPPAVTPQPAAPQPTPEPTFDSSG